MGERVHLTGRLDPLLQGWLFGGEFCSTLAERSSRCPSTCTGLAGKRGSPGRSWAAGMGGVIIHPIAQGSPYQAGLPWRFSL